MDPHDQAFFEQMRSCRDPYRRLGDAIHAIVGAGTAYDLGCGIGLQTKRLLELGWEITGLDHAPAAIAMIEPGVQINSFDLTRPGGGQPMKPAQVAICTETAEHIPAEFADAIVDNVVSLATDTIVWSAAVPGQEWPGHVNLQKPEYWTRRFAARGWVIDIARTGALRDLMCQSRAQHWGASENFFILAPGVKHRPIRITVTSTVLNAERYVERCIDSVQRQDYPHWRHVVVDAKSSDHTAYAARTIADRDRRTEVRVNVYRKSALENAWNIWSDLPDDEVIAWLDGDDYLAGDRALDVVARAYAAPGEPWLTYGQFMQPNGQISAADAYPPGSDIRSERWRATHLKTFRAGLVKKLRPQDLRNQFGDWCDLSIDRVVMYPLLEMAGEHALFIPNVLYVYNVASSWWMTQSESERERELGEVARLQGLPHYEQLKGRPW